MATKKRRKKSKKSEAAAPPEAARDALEALLDEVAIGGLGPVAPRPPDEPLAVLDTVEVSRAERVPFEGYVRVEAGDRVVRALGHDLSETGIFLAAMGSPIAGQGEELNLEIPLPDGEEPIWMTGRVVRCEERQGFFAVAVSFGHLISADRTRLKAYVSDRARLL
ncbi:MAG: PilZ domain-containing protein [Deltaproteobacteria bacterium]|nr:PilZ domain-containing protein [Deltaproteobacteria bacterium]